MPKRLLLILLVGLIHPEPLLAEGSCTLKCVKWFIFNCGRADLSCSGDLNCRNGDCGSLDAVATCRRSLSGNWTYIMDCGRMTPDSPGPQWQVAYRRPESLSHVIFSSGRDPLAFPRSAEAESLAADSDVVIRACPAPASFREEENPSALDLSAGLSRLLRAGLAVGTVTAEKDQLRLTLLAVDSKEEDVRLREELEALLLVPTQRAAPYWFVVFWKDGHVEGLALDL